MTITVLAVAGNGGCAARWSLLDKPLAPGVELVAASLPGFDGRAVPVPPVTMNKFAHALRRQADRIEGPVVVLGHGVGGSIAMHAAQINAWCEGLILLSPVGPALDTRLFPKVMRPKPIRHAARWAISSPAGRAAGKLRYRAVPGALVDEVFRGYERCDAFPFFFDLLNNRWWQSLHAISLPSVLLWGGDDGVLDQSHISQFERVLPEATTEIQPDWAHYPMLEQPADFGRVVADWAQRLAGEQS